MSEAFTDADYERMVRERDDALARIDSQRSQIAFYRNACTARFLPDGFGDETIRELINDLMEDRDDARSTIEDLNDEIARGREAIRIYRMEAEAAKRERDQEREACAMYAERSGRFAEQADRLQADLDDCRARSADMRTMLERVTRERDLALGRLENEIKAANQARMAEERARESLDELDEAIYDCLPWGDDESPLDCVEHAGDRIHALIKERDEARAERDAAIARITEVGVMVATNGNALAKDAYRRGAEAMREACALALLRDGLVLSRERAANVVRAMPIPEEP